MTHGKQPISGLKWYLIIWEWFLGYKLVWCGLVRWYSCMTHVVDLCRNYLDFIPNHSDPNGLHVLIQINLFYLVSLELHWNIQSMTSSWRHYNHSLDFSLTSFVIKRFYSKHEKFKNFSFFFRIDSEWFRYNKHLKRNRYLFITQF